MQNSGLNPNDARRPEPAARRRILVVEDDGDQRNALLQRLRFEGYEPSAAADVPGAIRAARLQRPDLILLDLGLPGGDGYTVIERLRVMPELSSIPILVLSARDAAREMPRAMLSGAVGYYQKPIRNKTLKAALEQALAG